MPKSSKKRKEKAADFTKAKLKLGKGKKPASNEIDTSFKAKSVALPNQTIRTEEHVAGQGIPTTRRRLTYDDLLTHLKHYSPTTRKDALQGLRELLSDHPWMIVPNLGSLLDAVAKLIADDDHSVRKALVSFLEWVLNQIPLSTLTPHAPPLLLFATAALAHISATIRTDAVRVINVLLEKAPQAVVFGADLRKSGEEGPGARILEGLMTAVGAGESKDVGTNLSLTSAAKSTVLDSLCTFLQHALLGPSMALDSLDNDFPTWYFDSAFASTSAFNSFVSALAPRASSEESTANLNRLELVSGPIGCDLDVLQTDSFAVDQARATTGGSPLNTLISRLHPVLISTFLDNAPQLRLDPSSSPASVELVVKVIDLARLVYRTAIRDGSLNEETSEKLGALLGHIAPYFPFGETVGLKMGETVNIKTREAMQSLNLAYCELVSFLVCQPQQLSQSLKRRARPRKSGHNLSDESSRKQVHEVAAYVVKCLRGELGSITGLPSALSLKAYTTLLPTLWALRAEQEILSTVLQHATLTAGGDKATKRIAVEFTGRIVLLDSDPLCITSVGLDKELVNEWILALPRAAWELGEKDPRGSEIILLLLLRISQRKLLSDAVLEALRQRFVPFFMIDRAAKGSIPGPWIKLPKGTQKLTLDLISSLCYSQPEGATALANAIERAAADKQLLDYWNSVRPAP